MNKNNVEHWKARIATDARHAASVAAEKQPRCRDCRVELSPECIRRIGSRIGLCDDCRAKQVAQSSQRKTKTRGYTCYVSGCAEPTHTIGGVCEKHNAEFRARWKAEHTRKPGDKHKGWLIGDKCQVTLKGITYQATILDMSDRADGDYLWTKLELTKTVKGFGGEPYTSTWVHPEPVQSYKLKKPLLKD